MKTRGMKSWLFASIAAGIAAIFQIYALIRYIGRLPDDWFGILLYVVTILAFLAGAFGFYLQWRQSKNAES